MEVLLLSLFFILLWWSFGKLFRHSVVLEVQRTTSHPKWANAWLSMHFTSLGWFIILNTQEKITSSHFGNFIGYLENSQENPKFVKVRQFPELQFGNLLLPIWEFIIPNIGKCSNIGNSTV